MRYKDDDNNVNEKLIAQQSICISNDLNGRDVCSAFELEKGFTRPIQRRAKQKFVQHHVIKARDLLMAKRKLDLILRSKSTYEIPVKIGDMVQVLIKLQNEKRGNWSNPKPVLEYDKPFGTVIFPGRNGHKINAAVEDVRFAITNDEFALKYEQAVDELKASMDNSISELPDEPPNQPSTLCDDSDPGEIGPTHPLSSRD